ncbi:MAG: hypothetical protein P4L85_27015 [Paludisphaera borealis]|uniref:hypothetical protein n=1 Tax=Paludisphaera borealis TaxID=1387353 RepID=UPI00284B8A81|nr:hypothetical protein [Paludisphaera borealis]MDR3623033.1 hypothetical protein [Paludisphaera borealis]
MYRMLCEGRAARRGFPLTREGPPSVDLEVLALFPVNRLVPDDSLFVREASDESAPTARPAALAELRQVWM